MVRGSAVARCRASFCTQVKCQAPFRMQCSKQPHAGCHGACNAADSTRRNVILSTLQLYKDMTGAWGWDAEKESVKRLLC